MSRKHKKALKAACELLEVTLPCPHDNGYRSPWYSKGRGWTCFDGLHRCHKISGDPKIPYYTKADCWEQWALNEAERIGDET